MQQPGQPGVPISDQLSTLAYRIASIEQQLADLRGQIREYELARESELKLQNVRDKVEGLSRDVLDIRREQTDIRARFVQQQLDAQKADSKQRERQDSLVIRVLQGGAVLALMGIISFLVNYFTHFIH